MLRQLPLELDVRSRDLYVRFVPADHPLRRLDAAVDFSFVLPLVADRYHPWIGRPAEHPARMWRLLFAQYYLNLSDRKVCLAAHESLALRWFLRLNADEEPPHPTTLQKFRFRRLDEGVYLRIHFRLLEQASERGLLSREERQILDTSDVHASRCVGRHWSNPLE
jgi:transposase